MIDSEKFAPLQIHGDLRSGKIPWAVHRKRHATIGLRGLFWRLWATRSDG
jgi:hypothetical protein